MIDGKYSEEFQIKILNSIGNLMLISKSHNCSIGNKPFSEKLESYNENPLLSQQAEIKDFLLDDEIRWDRDTIIKRQKRMLEFCLKKWSFDSLLKE